MNIVNASRPDDDFDLGDTQMTDRVRKLLKRRRELIAEAESLQLELQDVTRQLLEKRLDDQFDHRWPNL
jgi:hypothetical protein